MEPNRSYHWCPDIMWTLPFASRRPLHLKLAGPTGGLRVATGARGREVRHAARSSFPLTVDATAPRGKSLEFQWEASAVLARRPIDFSTQLSGPPKRQSKLGLGHRRVAASSSSSYGRIRVALLAGGNPVVGWASAIRPHRRCRDSARTARGDSRSCRRSPAPP
jgi:hypothetical protein